MQTKHPCFSQTTLWAVALGLFLLGCDLPQEGDPPLDGADTDSEADSDSATDTSAETDTDTDTDTFTDTDTELRTASPFYRPSSGSGAVSSTRYRGWVSVGGTLPPSSGASTNYRVGLGLGRAVQQ